MAQKTFPLCGAPWFLLNLGMGRHPKDFKIKQALPVLIIAILLIAVFYIVLEIKSRQQPADNLPPAKPGVSANKVSSPQTRELKLEESGALYAIKISYPEIISPSAAIKTANEALKNRVLAAKTDFVETEKDSEKFSLASGEKSELTIDYEILKISDSFASIKFNVSQYQAGGAHPNGYVFVVNLDLQNGKELALEEIFSGPWKEEASKFCAKSLLAQNEGAPLDAQNWIIEGTQPTVENFSVIGFSGSSALIFFNPYQVAPFAQGISVVDMPLQLLSGSLNPVSGKLIGK